MTINKGEGKTSRIVGTVSYTGGRGMPVAAYALINPPVDDGFPATITLVVQAMADRLAYTFNLAGWNDLQRRVEAIVREWPHGDQPSYLPGPYDESDEREHLAKELFWANRDVARLEVLLARLVSEKDEARQELAEMRRKYDQVNGMLDSIMAMAREKGQEVSND